MPKTGSSGVRVLRARAAGSVAGEHALAIVAIALAGTVGLGALGVSFDHAIDDGGGGAPSSARALSARAPSVRAMSAPQASSRGAGAVAVSAQAGAIEALTDLARRSRVVRVVEGLDGLGLPRGVEDLMHFEQELLSRRAGQFVIEPPKAHGLRPESRTVFELPSYWLGVDDARVFDSGHVPGALESTLFRVRDGKREVRFFVHPESDAFYRRAGLHTRATPGEPLYATATSSSRTLLAWDPAHPERPFFAKVSLDRELYGLDRKINGSQVARSIGIEGMLRKAEGLPPSFRWFSEVLGVIPEGMEQGGMIVRTIPDAVLSGERRYVPLFSLIAEPKDGSPPLLAKLIAESGLSAEAFVRRNLTHPFTEEFTRLRGEHGLASEPHAQNVLVRIGDDGTLRPDFLHRDLGGFTPHLEKRAELGFHDDALPVFDKLDYDYFQDTAAERLDSLVPYFGRRFLISIQELLPEWRANGWVAPAEPNAPTLGVGLSEEMKGASRRATRRGQRARR